MLHHYRQFLNPIHLQQEASQPETAEFHEPGAHPRTALTQAM